MKLTTNEQLSELLKIKRNEVPGKEFWETFEKDFEDRCLQEWIRQPFWRSCLGFLGRLRPAIVPAMAVFFAFSLWVSPETLSSPGVNSMGAPLFCHLNVNDAPMNALTASQFGNRGPVLYVAPALPSSGSGVTAFRF